MIWDNSETHGGGDDKSPAKVQLQLRATVDEAAPGLLDGVAAAHYESLDYLTRRWRDVPPDDRPASPREEFIRHRLTLGEADLLREWEGLGKEGEIRAIFHGPHAGLIHRDRQQFQLVGDAVELPDPSDPRVIQTYAKRDFYATRTLYERSQARELGEVKSKTRTVADAATGEVRRVVALEPMEVRDFVGEMQVQRGHRDELQLLTGQATQITASTTVELQMERRKEAEAELRDFRNQLRPSLQKEALPEAGGEALPAEPIRSALPDLNGEVIHERNR